MKKWLAKIFGKENRTQNSPAGTVFTIPWEINRKSIYQYLLPYAEGNEPLPEKAQILPDENRLKGELRWVRVASMALSGIMAEALLRKKPQNSCSIC